MLFETEGSLQVTAYANYDIRSQEKVPTVQAAARLYGNGAPKGYQPNGGGGFNTCPNNAAGGQTLKYATGYLGGEDPASSAFAGSDASCHWTGPLGRHSDGANYLMADCHAKWFRGAAVSPGANASNETDPQKPNPGNGGQAAGTAGTINGTVTGATFSVL